MPRSIWNGTITVGTIAVPIKVHSAIEDRTVHFHEVHDRDGARIEHKRICPNEGEEVPYSEIVKGFEVAPDEYVVLEKDEIKAAAGPRSRRLEVEEFVDAAAIDPVFYERTYYLGVREAADAYRVLHDALARAQRSGIARWHFHNREYLVAIRALDGILAMHTMRFEDEIVRGHELDVQAPSREPTAREIEMAGVLVDNLRVDFDPRDFNDTYRERILEYLQRKREGTAPEPVPADDRPQSDDLLAALKASIDAGGGR
ncbi:MAG: Ku protein [Actinobacteria bacterium]|nr:Ku protein [Actinomycetota bacterium]